MPGTHSQLFGELHDVFAGFRVVATDQHVALVELCLVCIEMTRTIRPLGRPDPGLERVDKASGFALHAGASSGVNQRNKRERIFRYIAWLPERRTAAYCSSGMNEYDLHAHRCERTTER